MRERQSTSASSSGKAPPESEVPAPRGTTLMRFSWQKRKILLTSSVVVGQHDGERQAAIGGQRVGLVGAAAFLVGDQARLGHELPKLLDDVVPAREHRRIRGR